eukprot:TRINITY_DN29833_c0_g1_i1.p1 TRINITY_DN29833_c0_g1~~TRINITY_DN29833_c0_g1_i1.p1  ORF type:complete len:431 (-),score=34.73 TRINITY_DN29833_c0_g1_i1:229-1416(-)
MLLHSRGHRARHDALCVQGGWQESGISSKAKPWSLSLTLGGALLGLCLALILLPPLILLALLLTLSEALHSFITACTNKARHIGGQEEIEGDDQHITLVLPGLCGYIFWQLGMLQYICERFDTSNVKLAGVSSGAIGAALLLALEEAAAKPGPEPEAMKVRRRAQEVFQLVEKSCAPIVGHPLGFVTRLGSVLDAMMDILPQGPIPDGRVRIGVRRFVLSPCPSLVPGVVHCFRSREELMTAIQASSTVWLVVRAWPFRWVNSLRSFCSDGVHIFSITWLLEYAQHLWDGTASRTGPHAAHPGLGRLYAAYNCGAMKLLLPHRGLKIWVTPTVGEHLDVKYCARFSGWFIAEQWRQGYVHARDLDAQGHFQGLTRRRTTMPSCKVRESNKVPKMQ